MDAAASSPMSPNSLAASRNPSAWSMIAGNPERKDMLSFIPEAWGPKLHVPSGSIAYTRVGPNAIRFTSKAHLAVILLSSQLHSTITLNGDRREMLNAAAGTFELVPANTELFAEWRSSVECILFGLPPERIRELTIAEYDDDKTTFLLPAPGHVDIDALRLAKLFEKEFRHCHNGSANKIYLDSLLTVFSTHVVRRYVNARKVSPPSKRGGLRGTVMRQVDAYIHANLTQNLSVVELAAVAGLSPSHFARAFRETVGRPPYQHITFLRLRRVQAMINDRSLTLGEIAAKAGFSTHSQMTATMKQYWGVTPSELRQLEKRTRFNDQRSRARGVSRTIRLD